jgi:hypothetical protein
MTPKSSVPPSLAPSGGPAARREESAAAMRRAQTTGAVPVTPLVEPEPAAPAPVGPPVDTSIARPVGKERSGKLRSARFVVGAILVLCLVAVGIGTLGRALWSDDDPGDDAPSTEPTDPTGESVDDTDPDGTGPSTSAATGLAAGLPAPAVVFSPVCPSPGGGWQLQPVWPGDLDELVQYDIELQQLDGTWTQLDPLPSATTPWGSLVGQPPATSLVIRITAVMTDGSRSISRPTDVVTPATAC